MDGKKRIGVHALKNRFLAGSPTNGVPWHFGKPAQSPPQKTPLVKLKPTQIKPLCCPHSVALTQEEYAVNLYAFSNATRKQADKINSGESDGVNLVLLRSSSCLQCSPVCDHGQPMGNDEVTEALRSGKRFSPNCAACTGSESIEDWERILKDYGLPPTRGLSPAKHVISKPDGTTHSLGKGKNFQTGNNDIERRDGTSTVSRDDTPAKRSRPKGYGSDDAEDTTFAGLRGESDDNADSETALLADLRTREIKEEFERPDPNPDEEN